MRAFITGITGQDGSYLAEQLLGDGHEVYGLIRRSSNEQMPRIKHLLSNTRLKLVYGDLTDSGCLHRYISEIQPDEVYNLGAQSHVHVSYDCPAYTFDAVANGTLNLLDAVRLEYPVARFYQAGSSEQYGTSVGANGFQDETTEFHPVSPYAVAKTAAFNLVRCYRESYNMFACNGILFNHETLTSYTPILYRIGLNGQIDIKPIGEVVRKHTGLIFDEDKNVYQSGRPVTDLYVWSYKGWTKVTYASGYKHNIEEDQKDPKTVNSGMIAFAATSSHVVFNKDGEEVEVGSLQTGNTVQQCGYPQVDDLEELTETEAELLGLLVSERYHNEGSHCKITNKDDTLLRRVEFLWTSLGFSSTFGWSISGFTGEKIRYLSLNGGGEWLRKHVIYTEDRSKCIPQSILNASQSIQMLFLQGYNAGDGLKAGRGVCEFKNFKTESMTLASGLVFLLARTTGQEYNVTVESSDCWGGESLYYSINVLSHSRYSIRKSRLKADLARSFISEGYSQRSVSKKLGINRKMIRMAVAGYVPSNKHNFEVDRSKIKKILYHPNYDGWFYDLETENGEFACGIGMARVHNSPRRGDNFVTRKITRYVGWLVNHIGCDEIPNLQLGNLNASRDWGYAPDYVRAMRLMLQQDRPDDYVIATGETHTVKEFLDAAFSCVGLDWMDYVETNTNLRRPSEVPLLRGNSSKARRVLGWSESVTFKELVEIMVKHDTWEEKKKKGGHISCL